MITDNTLHFYFREIDPFRVQDDDIFFALVYENAEGLLSNPYITVSARNHTWVLIFRDPWITKYFIANAYGDMKVIPRALNPSHIREIDYPFIFLEKILYKDPYNLCIPRIYLGVNEIVISEKDYATIHVLIENSDEMKGVKNNDD